MKGQDSFVVLMPGGTVESPLIWESSRFAVNPQIFEASDRAEANHIVNRTTVELLRGMVEAAQRAGIEHIVSVFDARVARIFRLIDCRFEQLGTPVRIGKVMAYAGLFDIGADMRSRLGAAGDFRSSVLADDAIPLPSATSLFAIVE